ncbi:CRAL/TRIO domain-containing protein [Gonapodya prolifera JEL478]|uniref:CRAL/TRIO domain-containing protein n=1 Tax=Gonapodya prolifera (strain JEL478) TaxID=1344416 RepID=A0A138ZYQ5_GONPJ|nr:CRAL/TRIO domain-containing protein [Gonapodya prolifera JEL478]|eukprot:KXS09405.1 CRAL/TRIO domain-containing protein [Gonapodya prolifera JEL478]
MSGFLDDLSPEQETGLSTLIAKLTNDLPQSGLNDDDLDLWEVSVKDLSKPTKAQKVVLLKFLRAREFDIDKSKDMLLATLKWRKEYNMKGLLSETFDPAFHQAGYLFGKDRKGHPVTYNTYGQLNYDVIFKGGVDTFIRWRIQLMEKAVALLDFENGIERVTQVHDYSGVSFFGMNADVRAASKVIIEKFQDNYPEFLERKFFLHIPTLMEWIFGVLSRLSSARTLAKFSMVGPGSVRSTLLQFIAPTELPAVYGGFDTEVTSQESSAGVERVTIPAGEKKVVEQQIAKESSEIQYEWIVEGAGDIAIGAHVVTDDAATDDKVELKRAENGKNKIKADKTGKLRLIFDNTYSRFTAKQVSYRVTVL